MDSRAIGHPSLPRGSRACHARAGCPASCGTVSGRVALVTGGGRGIGEAVAVVLARDGARAVLAARTRAELDRVAARVRAAGGQADVVTGDVSRPEDVAAMAHAALTASGHIDILVNAAGVYGPIGPLWELEAGAWWRALEVNLRGTFLCCHAVLPHM